jgi:DNA-binding beta-propeller fold protein YncE
MAGADPPVRGLHRDDQDSAAVWVQDSSLGTVNALEPQTLEPIGNAIRVGDEPIDISVGLGEVWVANAGEGTISRIDPQTRQVTPIEVGSPFVSVVPNQSTNTVWVAVAERATSEISRAQSSLGVRRAGR